MRNSASLPTLSVVLACANEDKYPLLTAQSVAAATPAGVLAEILIVDDGSNPPVRDLFGEEDLRKLKVKIIRHESHTGLINAKRVGGNAATGDVIVFLDCHVKPRANWHQGILSRMADNYRRVVVPSITGLDPDTWQEEGGGDGGLAKCYLTWDVDFKWFDSDENFVPIMSGGLLAMSRRWWQETGGYDSRMQGWGGENIDQSLRIWLCGGEIVQATDSFVAHMWRTPDKPSSRAKYTVPPGSTMLNRYRAGAAWMGPQLTQKLVSDFPSYFPPSLTNTQEADVSEIAAVRDRLQCKPFVWFLNRFKDVYIDAGLVPAQVFRIKDAVTGLCLQRDPVVLTLCSNVPTQWWHRANRRRSNGQSAGCCAGFRNWNSDQCLQTRPTVGAAANTAVCNTFGLVSDQVMEITETGSLKTGHGTCLTPAKEPGLSLELMDCAMAQQFELQGTRISETNKSGLCVTMVEGERLEMTPCDQLDDAQSFKVGHGQIRNGHHCLDGNGKLTAYPCHGVGQVGFTQKFSIDGQGKIRQKGNICVGYVSANQERTETPVKLENCVAERQSQTVTKIGLGKSQGEFRLSSGENKCLGVSVSSSKQIVVSVCNENDVGQNWKETEHQQLKHTSSSLCLDAGNGSDPILYTCYSNKSGNPNQQWNFTDSTLRNFRTSRCLDFVPLRPKPLITTSCSSATAKFQTVDAFVPVETAVYRASYLSD